MKVERIRIPAILCALALPLSALAIRPVVEMGINDDWSYIKTVQLLAQTGHIVYNGWSTAMLGWQLYLGAMFVKLFGFSFTIVRVSILPIAMATAFLTQRTLVRAGISEWNASLGTLVLVVSPLFLPLTFSFMTDIPGLFCIVLCLYACLRALQAKTDRAALAWIAFAAVSNAIGGTVRQIVWLGVLVMVPSTLWLFRRRSRFLLAGGLLYLASVTFVFASLYWFRHQPYSVPETIIQDHVTLQTFAMLFKNLLRASLDTSLFLLPILLIFIPELRRGNRRFLMFSAVAMSFVVLVALIDIVHISYWFAPYLGNYVTIYGLLADGSVHGERIVLHTGIRILVTILNIVSVLSLFALLLANKKRPNLKSDPSQISWYSLSLLIAPFTVAYIVLLIPRAAMGKLFFDRYLLPIMMMVLIAVLRFYQERVQPRVPTWTLLPIAIFAAFSIAGTHDVFAILRGRLAAVEELRSAGVPPTAIDAGFEYNGWTQIERARYINDPRIPILPGDHFSTLKIPYKVCRPLFIEEFSVLAPRYSMAYDPQECEGPAQFAPVTVRTWLGPRSTTLYLVNIGDSPQSKNLAPSSLSDQE